MRILYISCHEVLEYDELLLLTELGHEVFSLQGAYMYPAGSPVLRRPAVPGLKQRDELIAEAATFPRTEIPDSFLDKFDLIIVMHVPDIITQNWKAFKGRRVIWRTIGQSTPGVERQLRKCRDEGLKIIRYSPYEEKLDHYIGADAMIRFYKDPNEYKEWVGNDAKIINFTQTLKGRRDFCGYDALMKFGPGHPFKVFGSGNEDLGEFNGGYLTHDLMKGQLRDSRVFLYAGTWPASYTLSFIEAWMTGIPIVAVGMDMWRHKDNMDVKTYEIPKLINNGDTGFCYDNPDLISKAIERLLTDHEYAKRISKLAREEAINVFGKETIKSQWQSYLQSVC